MTSSFLKASFSGHMKRSVPHQGSLASEEIDTIHAPIMAMAGCAYPFQEISSRKTSIDILFEVTCFGFLAVLYVLSMPFLQR